jgi:hypothetical protein
MTLVSRRKYSLAVKQFKDEAVVLFEYSLQQLSEREMLLSCQGGSKDKVNGAEGYI